ncbi:MAG: hypothetical protein JSS61_07160, partial [Verrucomicrobia bacterium]|nr:hypothetical protein [Verrucomicrobiota bacterium]
ALLPPLARAAKEGLRERYFELVHFAFRKSFSLIFPCTLGLFVLGLAGINLLYGHGDFHEMATLETTICLWGYGIGLLPAVFVLLLAPAFYAEKDYQVPMRGSLLAVAVNVLLSSGFVFSLGWGAFSIAVATSIAGWVNFFYLSYHFRAKMEKGLFERGSIRPFLQVAGCSLFAGAVTLFLGDLIYGDATLSFCFVDEPIYLTRSFGEQLAQFAALCGTFVSVLFASSWITGAEDVLELVRIKKKQLTM